MKKRLINISLMLLLFVAVAFASYATYSYLTKQGSINNNFEIDSVTGTITVNGTTDVNTVINNNEIAYIDYINDFILNKNNRNLLDDMATEIKIKIVVDETTKNNFPTRIKVMIPKLSTMTGLLYIVIPEEEANQSKKIQLNLTAQKVLQFGYLENNQVASWTDLTDLDLSTFNEATSTTEFRNNVETYNYNLLSNYYLNNVINKNTTVNKCFRILLWGDYHNLPESDKMVNGKLTDKYLKNTHDFKMTVKIIQDIQSYGGEPNYEND